MTQNEIIEMARQAGGEFYVTSGNQTPTWYFPHSTIYDFAKLVVAKERRECAKLAAEVGYWGLVHEIEARGKQA